MGHLLLADDGSDLHRCIHIPFGGLVVSDFLRATVGAAYLRVRVGQLLTLAIDLILLLRIRAYVLESFVCDSESTSQLLSECFAF